jgi:UDP-N-acetylmuramyl tripeptide synthase
VTITPSALPVRGRFALTAGRAAGSLSRVLKFDSGSTIGGAGKLAAHRRVVLVSGTNGKATTTGMLAAACRRRGAVVTNDTGANLQAGLVRTLGKNLTAPTAVLEVDEAQLPVSTAAAVPAVTVLLNLTRDKLDRVAEVRCLMERWREAVRAPQHRGVVVANADDPLTAYAASGASRVVWVAPGQRWRADSVLCPWCSGVLVRDEPAWRCGECEARRPEPDYVLDGERLRLPDGGVLRLRLGLPGHASRVNAAFAIAAASAGCGLPPGEALDAISELRSVSGQYSVVRVAGRELRLLLAGNPAGWLETLDLLAPCGRPVVVGVNARAADGRDTSWLWDVPFERLRGRRVLAIGDRRLDLAVRLRYAGVDADVLDDIPALTRALPAAPGPVDCAVTHTAFHDIMGHANAA